MGARVSNVHNKRRSAATTTVQLILSWIADVIQQGSHVRLVYAFVAVNVRCPLVENRILSRIADVVQQVYYI